MLAAAAAVGGDHPPSQSKLHCHPIHTAHHTHSTPTTTTTNASTPLQRSNSLEGGIRRVRGGHSSPGATLKACLSTSRRRILSLTASFAPSGGQVQGREHNHHHPRHFLDPHHGHHRSASQGHLGLMTRDKVSDVVPVDPLMAQDPNPLPHPDSRRGIKGASSRTRVSHSTSSSTCSSSSFSSLLSSSSSFNSFSSTAAMPPLALPLSLSRPPTSTSTSTSSAPSHPHPCSSPASSSSSSSSTSSLHSTSNNSNNSTLSTTLATTTSSSSSSIVASRSYRSLSSPCSCPQSSSSPGFSTFSSPAHSTLFPNNSNNNNHRHSCQYPAHRSPLVPSSPNPATTLPPLPLFAPLPLTEVVPEFSTTMVSPLSAPLPLPSSRTGMLTPESNMSMSIHASSSISIPSHYNTHSMASSVQSESSFVSSRRSSKDSSDSAAGTSLDDLVDQLTVPDYQKPHDQIAKTRVFLIIYRKFAKPRELLEMLIERFDVLGDHIDEEDMEANNTRLRICSCLHFWLKNHPNDFLHRQTRQRLAAFLRERVALFPCLAEIYSKILPLSSIHYFNSWRWPASEHGSESRSSSVSSARLSASFSDDDSDSGFHDSSNLHSEDVMDEDREWGMVDEDEVPPQGKPIPNMDTLSPFSQTAGAYRRSLQQLPRDRRSSTGSFAHASPCAMETFVAGRRGSASSASSNPGPFTAAGSALALQAFPEGDLTPMQLQPIGAIPYISKRSSSQSYRQRNLHTSVSPKSSPLTQWPTAPELTPTAAAAANAALIFKDSMEERIHPLHGKGSSIPSSPRSMAMESFNVSFVDMKDYCIAEQLTCVEYLLFKKLKPRDMLRHVWRTKKGSSTFTECIAHFNYISSWVGTMILSPPKAKGRAKMMEKFISIAKILREMGNLNTMMAIIGAMNNSSIHRLSQTRELCQAKESVWSTYKELEKLMSSDRNYLDYRATIKTMKLPCIPYLGVHLHDLWSISEGNKDFRQDGTLHWQKFVLMTDVISTVMHFQSEPYKFQPDPFISRAITGAHVLDEEELYTKSVAAEPSKLNHSRSLSKFTFF